MKSIDLEEFGPRKTLVEQEFDYLIAEELLNNYPNKFEIEFPSRRNNSSWKIRALGLVGHIPLQDGAFISIEPKIKIHNIFGMLEYAYDLEGFKLLHDLVHLETLQELYEKLADILAQRIVARTQKGLYRSYVSRSSGLPFLRGRLNTSSIHRTLWDPSFYCRYGDHTPDLTDNQILMWTMQSILRTGFCGEKALPNVQQAYRRLASMVSSKRFSGPDCENRSYTRLNDDYEILHSLCRFFLDNTGPMHSKGDQKMMPFLIDMASLFEKFVARWLERWIDPDLKIEAQHRVPLSPIEALEFKIDLLISDRLTNTPLMVLDTKYKADAVPSTDDIAQVVAYAESKGCKEAVLVYPHREISKLNVPVGRIQVLCLPFELDEDLESAGQIFLQRIRSLLIKLKTSALNSSVTPI